MAELFWRRNFFSAAKKTKHCWVSDDAIFEEKEEEEEDDDDDGDEDLANRRLKKKNGIIYFQETLESNWIFLKHPRNEPRIIDKRRK